MRKRRRNKASALHKTLERRVGEATFTGKKKDVQCQLDINELPKGFLLVGELIELECETPEEAKVDSLKLIKSRKSPIVTASGDGKLVAIVSGDSVKGNVWIDPDHDDVKEAVTLHQAFHGTKHDKIKLVNTRDTDWLIFWGHLNHIVYDVPKYSERRGVPFIHEAKDRGDGALPAEEKPIVCLSPNRDFLIMYGVQFEFTERGIIG